MSTFNLVTLRIRRNCRWCGHTLSVVWDRILAKKKPDLHIANSYLESYGGGRLEEDIQGDGAFDKDPGTLIISPVKRQGEHQNAIEEGAQRGLKKRRIKTLNYDVLEEG